MKRVLAISLALLLAGTSSLSAQAEDDKEGFSLMEEGAQLFLRGLMAELDPALRELEEIAEEIEPAFREMARQMGPAFAEIMATIDNIRFYEAPVILENGDILIRRREDAPPYEPRDPEPETEEGGEIEL